jgi:hypothetical protein
MARSSSKGVILCCPDQQSSGRRDKICRQRLHRQRRDAERGDPLDRGQSGNQLLLLLGISRAARQANARHPFGHMGPAFVEELPVSKFRGGGPVTAAKMAKLGGDRSFPQRRGIYPRAIPRGTLHRAADRTGSHCRRPCGHRDREHAAHHRDARGPRPADRDRRGARVISPPSLRAAVGTRGMRWLPVGQCGRADRR